MAEILDHHHAFSALRPPQTYARIPPSVFNAVNHDPDLLRWFYAKIAEPIAHAPQEGFMFLPRCFAFDGRYLLDENLEWITPTLADWSVPDEMDTWIKDTFRQTKTEPSNQGGTDWHHVLFAQCNSENYGHYLCEAAPKLINMARAGFKKIRYILPENCRRYEGFTNALLGHLGIQSEAMIVPAAGFTAYVDLIYFTPVSQHDFRKSPTLLEFRDVALSLYGQKGGGRRKLFVQRSSGDRRQISNQAEVTDILSGLGYEAVYPGSMTTQEQVEVFSSAVSVVGSVGAGFTNIMFSPTGSDVFYICNGLIDPFFWDIACLCSQKFSWFFAQAPRRFNEQDFTNNFYVDPGSLSAALIQAAS